VRDDIKPSSPVIDAFATAARPRDAASSVRATTFVAHGATSSSIVTAFLRVQSLACLMPPTAARSARAASVSILSHFIIIIILPGMSGHPGPMQRSTV
jgi:hypothetical protein